MEYFCDDKVKETKTSAPWFALRCKSNMEFIVDDQLRAKNISEYLPLCLVNPVNPRSRSARPYFPGYLFVQGEPENLYAQRVFLMRGVIGLVNFDGVPASIHPSLIEAIRQQTSQQNHEYLRARTGFAPGDEVVVENNAIGEIAAIFEKCVNGTERVSVLLKLMQGRMVRMELPAEMIRRKVGQYN